MRARSVIAGLLLGLALSAGAVAYAWWQLEGVLSVHGWIALSLGVVLTVALAAGLMSLVFYSHRRGFDDEAGHP